MDYEYYYGVVERVSDQYSEDPGLIPGYDSRFFLYSGNVHTCTTVKVYILLGNDMHMSITVTTL